MAAAPALGLCERYGHTRCEGKGGATTRSSLTLTCGLAALTPWQAISGAIPSSSHVA